MQLRTPSSRYVVTLLFQQIGYGQFAVTSSNRTLVPSGSRAYTGAEGHTASVNIPAREGEHKGAGAGIQVNLTPFASGQYSASLSATVSRQITIAKIIRCRQ